MKTFEERNLHFDRLIARPGLRWLGQNTNHLPPPQAVLDALDRAIADREFQIYAPPSGLEELRAGIIADLGLEGASVHVTDGAVAALYHVVKTLIRPGETMVTTDPTWAWPVSFAREAGATVRQVPIYGAEHGYRLSPERLAQAMTADTRIVYLVDPNNPLGTVASADDIRQIVEIVRAAGAWLIQDATYRHFAHEHHLAARLYPEGTVTTYSFSKWLGLAGLRIGAVVGAPDLIERLAAAPPNNLGSNILAQRAAIAGLKAKDEWFPGVLKTTRANQDRIAAAVAKTPGLVMPVYPSNGNFVVIECGEADIRPEALCAAYREKNILIRQGSYHTATYGDRFVKVSTSVPGEWVEEFAGQLPEMVERARGMNADVRLF